MEFLLLNSVGVQHDGDEINVGGPRQRAVLALLLLNRNHRVPADRIVDGLWDEPPKSARNSVQRFVADLRSSHSELADRLASDRAGYALRVEADELDLGRFEALNLEATSLNAAGDTEAEATVLRTALNEWSGRPLDGIGDPPFAQPEQTRLSEAKLQTFERWVDAELSLGHHHDLVPSIQAEAAINPFRERIWAQLITALYHSQRQADALAAYTTLRDTLLDELGVDPTAELRELELQILNHELPTVRVSAAAQPNGVGITSRGYELGETIGEGNTGRVLAARQLSTGRDVAVKVIDADTADDPPFIRAFDEANKGIAGLEHPHIIPMYDWWREPSAAYVVMRLLRGGTLHGDVPLDDESRRAALAQVADALRVAHDRGIHHGAVIPANVLLDGEGNAYLTDFGIGHAATRETDIEALAVLIEQQLPGQLGDSSFDSVDDLLRALDGPPTGRSDTATPYKGLRAFQEADAADFFGRDELVDNMVDRVRGGRFLALIGASGSGKSSAVRAGLLPRLRRGGIAGSENWFIVDMIPGAAPLDELVRAMRRVAVNPPDDLRSLVGSGPDGLAQAIELVLPEPGTEMVLVIDQFEELFTLVSSERARRRFIESLVAAVNDPRSRLRVVVTMRADFHDRPLASAGLGSLFVAGTESVIALRAEELERAIVGPGERAGITFDAGLVAEMVSEVVDQPSTLPLLQYALTEMFDARTSDRISIEDYREVGGVLGALARRADWLYDRQPGSQQLLLRQLLLRLVTVGDDSRSDTRRRVTRSELDALGDRQLIDQVLSEFGRHRLLTFDRDPKTGEPVVEVAHEALLREWALLRDWIEQSRADLLQHRRITAGARDWIQAERDPSFLVRGARLERIIAWRETAELALTADEADFIRASVEVRSDEYAIERERLAHEAELEQQANRRLRLLVGVLAAAAVVGIALSLFAFQQSRTARDQRAQAESQARRATAQSLASAAIIDLPVDPERSLLLALESIEVSAAGDLDPPDDAIVALHEGLNRNRLVRRFDGEFAAASYAPDGRLIAAAGLDGSIALLNSSDGSVERTIDKAHDGQIGTVVFDRAGERLATSGRDGDVRIWDVETGLLLATLSEVTRPGSSFSAGVVFSPEGDRILTGSSDGALQVWDSSTGELLVRAVLNQGGGDQPIGSWLPDGRIVAFTASGQPKVIILDPDNLDLLEEVDEDLQPSCTAGFANESGQIVLGEVDSSLISPNTGEGPLALVGHTGPVCTVAFAPDDSRVATGSVDGTIRIWSTTDGESKMLLAGHGAFVGTVSFDPTGTLLLSVSAAGDMFEWDISPAFDVELLSVDITDLRAARLTAAGDRIIARDDRGLRLIEVDTGRTLAEVQLPPPNMRTLDRFDVSADDSLVAIPAAASSGVEIRSLDTLDLVQTLQGPPELIYEVRFDAAVEHVVGYTTSGALMRWSLDDGELLWSTGDEDGFEQFEINPSGTIIAAPRQETIDLHDSATGEIIQQLAGLPQLSLAWIDDEYFLSAGLSGEISVWKVGSSEPQRVFTAAGGSELLRIDGNRRLVFIGALDGSVTALSLDDGREVLTLPAHTANIIALSLDASGERLLSADRSGTVHVRALDTSTLAEIARDRITRSLTDEECLTYRGEAECL